MNKRQVGDEFEKYIAKLLPELNITARSGAHWDNADLTGPGVIIEAKVKNKPRLTISWNEIVKLKKQAEKHTVDWIYAVKDSNDKKYAICDLDFMIELLEDHFWRKNVG
jgi:hypothetical protein